MNNKMKKLDENVLAKVSVLIEKSRTQIASDPVAHSKAVAANGVIL
jgi:hypothetical protein